MRSRVEVFIGKNVAVSGEASIGYHDTQQRAFKETGIVLISDNFVML